MKPGPLWEKKDKHCDPRAPADRVQGSYWDHVLLDAETKLIVSLVVGRRTAATAHAAFLDFYERTNGWLPALITTDAYAPYLAIIIDVYGVRKEELELTEAEKAELQWAQWPALYFPVEIAYATVHKERVNGRVVRVERQVVLGSQEQVAAALCQGTTAPTINTNYVERWNGTNRHFNARKARKVYTFSKELLFHVAVTWLCVVFYNFGWQPRPLRQKIQEEPPRYCYRTPAMAAGLTEAPWSWQQILAYPIYDRQRVPNSPKRRRQKKKS
jgi:IS1 family transposase